jgi:hypothetical protein
MSRMDSFMADQRGAVAFELPSIYWFLFFCLLLPLADLAMAGIQYISARGALRAFGQLILYSQPADVTNPGSPSSPGSWAAIVLAKADPRYPIPSIQIICGESGALCSASNITTATGLPTAKYYSYTTAVTLSPLFLKSVLCTSPITSTNTNPCTFTLSYSERFQ